MVTGGRDISALLAAKGPSQAPPRPEMPEMPEILDDLPALWLKWRDHRDQITPAETNLLVRDQERKDLMNFKPKVKAWLKPVGPRWKN